VADKRLRSARPGPEQTRSQRQPRRTADDGRPVTTFTPAASARPRRPGAARTAEPAGPGGSPTRRHCPRTPGRVDAEAGNPWPDDAWPDDPMSGDPTATDPKLGTAALEAGETRPIATTAAAKPRRRKGFRKGADLDEELWPPSRSAASATSSSGTILRRTSRSPPPRVPPSRNRRAGTGCPVPRRAPGASPGPLPTPLLGSTPGRPRPADRPGPRQATGNAMSGVPAEAGGAGIRPCAPRPIRRPNGPRYSLPTRRRSTVRGMKPPVPGGNAAGPRGCHSAARNRCPAEGGCHLRRAEPLPSRVRPAPSRPRRADGRPSSAEEDPLTSAAFSLRPSGPVDGPVVPPGPERLSGPLRHRHLPLPVLGAFLRKREPGGTGGRTATAYGNGSHARPEDPGDATRPARQAYPRGSHQATGSYRSNGSYPANGYPATAIRAMGIAATATAPLRPARRLPAFNAPALT
jgi:hypothetical protein